MKKVVAEASLIAILALLCCSSLFAQTYSTPEYREWEVTPFLGPTTGAKFEFPTPVVGGDQESVRTVGIRYDTGFLLGVRVTQNLGDYWAADLEYSVANQRLHFTNFSPAIPNLSLSHYVHDISYNISGLPLPRTKRFRPYADLGGGLVLFYIPGSVKKDVSGLRDSWEWLFNWGGGFKYLVVDQFALTVDVKDRVSPVPSYELPVAATIVNGRYQPGMARHGLVNLWQFSVGFSFQWDQEGLTFANRPIGTLVRN